MAFLTHSLGLSLSFDGSRVFWVLIKTKRVLADPPLHTIVDLGTAESGARYDLVFELLSKRLDLLYRDDDFRDPVLVLPEASAPFAGFAFVRSLFASRFARRVQPAVRIRPCELSGKVDHGADPSGGWRAFLSRNEVFGAMRFAHTRRAVVYPRHPLTAQLRADYDRIRTKKVLEEDEAGLALALAVVLWYREREAEGHPGAIVPMTYT
ncbi:MAG: hypothetical protein ACYC4P_11575 [Thermoanaerobaculia bacterium]